MKILTVRASGLPVQDLDKYHEEYRTMYDKVIKKLGLSPKVMPTQEQAERATKLLYRAERMLQRRYPTKEYWDFVKTKSAWKKLNEKYGSIAVTTNPETKNLSYVILDIEI